MLLFPESTIKAAIDTLKEVAILVVLAILVVVVVVVVVIVEKAVVERRCCSSPSRPSRRPSTRSKRWRF